MEHLSVFWLASGAGAVLFYPLIGVWCRNRALTLQARVVRQANVFLDDVNALRNESQILANRAAGVVNPPVQSSKALTAANSKQIAIIGAAAILPDRNYVRIRAEIARHGVEDDPKLLPSLNRMRPLEANLWESMKKLNDAILDLNVFLKKAPGCAYAGRWLDVYPLPPVNQSVAYDLLNSIRDLTASDVNHPAFHIPTED